MAQSHVHVRGLLYFTCEKVPSIGSNYRLHEGVYFIFAYEGKDMLLSSFRMGYFEHYYFRHTKKQTKKLS